MASPAPVDVEHVARIARLALTPDERARLARDAQAILAHFEEVEAALAGPAEEPRTLEPRPDEPLDPDAAQVAAIVGQFPRTDGRRCKVPEGL